MLPYIEIAGRTIPMYGLMGVCGFVAALLLIVVLGRRLRVDRENAVYLFVFTVIGAMAGAKLLYLCTVWSDVVADLPLIWQDPATFVGTYLSGGFVFYGGLIGGAAMAFGYCAAFRWRLVDYLPVLVPAIPLMHAFGRVGCFCAGCCYGIEVPWGMTYTHAVSGPNGVPLFPVQLVEAGCELVICAMLVAVSVRTFGRNRNPKASPRRDPHPTFGQGSRDELQAQRQLQAQCASSACNSQLHREPEPDCEPQPHREPESDCDPESNCESHRWSQVAHSPNPWGASPNPWGLLALYCLMYAPVRFVLEFFRGDAVRGFWLGLSTSQWLSIAAVIIAAGVVWRISSVGRRRPAAAVEPHDAQPAG